MKKQSAITDILATGALLGSMLSSAAVAQDNSVQKTDSLQKFEYTKYVASGKKTVLGFGYALNPDCSTVGPVDVRLTTPPQHGTVEIAPGSYFPSYAKDNVRSKCNEKSTDGMITYYQSKDSYTGIDKFDVFVLSSNGFAQEIHYIVNVR